MFNNSELSSDFWDIPKEPKIPSASLELLLLFLEINIIHLTLHDTAQRVHCSVTRAALFRENLNLTLFPICNSLLRKASTMSLRGS